MNFDSLWCKAKRYNSDEWISGYFFQIWEDCFLSWGTTNGVRNSIQIDPDTLCQCTGLKDDNGMLIFEGDICRVSMGEYYMGVWEYSSECECQWCATGFDFVNDNGCGNAWGFAFDPEEIIVVGNIHDKEGDENV